MPSFTGDSYSTPESDDIDALGGNDAGVNVGDVHVAINRIGGMRMRQPLADSCACTDGAGSSNSAGSVDFVPDYDAMQWVGPTSRWLDPKFCLQLAVTGRPRAVPLSTRTRACACIGLMRSAGSV